MANLAAFDYSINKEKTEAESSQKMNKRIRELEKAMSAGRLSGSDAVASLSTGKRGT